MRKTKYRLYAFRLTDEALTMALKERFSRICADYLLIYTKRKMQGGAEITERESHRMNAEERQWLLDCNLALLAEDARTHSDRLLIGLSQRLDALEAALKREAEKENVVTDEAALRPNEDTERDNDANSTGEKSDN